VVVLDLDLNGENGSEIIPALNDLGKSKVLVLTGVRDAKTKEASILRGASGLVHKEESAETILKAIEKVHQGELWLDRATTGRVFVELSRRKAQSAAEPELQRLDSLTSREREIVGQLVADPGAENKKLAQKLHIAEHTLRNHLSRIYDKLGVPSRLELYVFAQKHGLHSSRGGPERKG
jgi:DNA-binding NarL/FixJ family response regulator